jgi:hypothetical protein
MERALIKNEASLMFNQARNVTLCVQKRNHISSLPAISSNWLSETEFIKRFRHSTYQFLLHVFSVLSPPFKVKFQNIPGIVCI